MISKMVGYLIITHKFNILCVGIFLKIEYCVGESSYNWVNLVNEDASFHQCDTMSTGKSSPP
jgi:hypothetical protein